MISQSIRTSQVEINLDDLFSQLIDESRRLKSKEDKEMALNSKASSGGAKPKEDKPKKTKRICNHCRKSGHNEDKCWIKHPSLRPQNKTINEDTPEEVSLISHTETALYSENSTEWILDSGATSYICSNRALFTQLEPCDIALKWGSASQIRTSGIGRIKIYFESTNQKAEISNCLYVPELGVNLLSLYALNERGLNTIFNPTNYLIRKGKTIIAHGSYC